MEEFGRLAEYVLPARAIMSLLEPMTCHVGHMFQPCFTAPEQKRLGQEFTCGFIHSSFEPGLPQDMPMVQGKDVLSTCIDCRCYGILIHPGSGPLVLARIHGR